MRIGTNIYNGQVVNKSLEDFGHTIVSATTGGGKSNLLYLIACATLKNSSTRLCGLDASGILFSALPPGDEFRWSLGDERGAPGIIEVLEKLVKSMQVRLDYLRLNQLDQFSGDAFSEAFPRMVVIIEEWPAILSLLSVYDLENNLKGSNRLETRCKALVYKLFAESRKTGMKIFISSQTNTKELLTFRNNVNSIAMFKQEPTEIRMLAPNLDERTTHQILTAPPGLCLLTTGSKRQLVKVDYLPFEIFRLVCKEQQGGVS